MGWSAKARGCPLVHKGCSDAASPHVHAHIVAPGFISTGHCYPSTCRVKAKPREEKAGLQVGHRTLHLESGNGRGTADKLDDYSINPRKMLIAASVQAGTEVGGG